MTDFLSIKEARKAILLSQGLCRSNKAKTSQKSAYESTHTIIESLNYIQIDSISVVERAHHHILWSRLKNYSPTFLNKLLEQQQVFEYWSHAAAYLPMRDFRFSLPRKNAIAQGQQHWFSKDKKCMSQVLDRIKTDGPLQAKNFDDNRKTKTGWWDWKPAKKALEQLFMEGELMVTKRQGFQKVYDLTERILPNNVNTTMPSDDEYYRHLIVNYLKANAIGTPEQMAYLLKKHKAPIKQYCNELLEDGLLINLMVNKQPYFALPTVSDALKKRISRSQVKILSPFDNLLIQRKRTKTLFNFDYQIECYVPAAKRKVGYFSLPLLWADQFVRRMDAKMDRKSGILFIQNLHIETSNIELLINELKKALYDFLVFNNGKAIQVVKITGAKHELSKGVIQELTTQLTLLSNDNYT